MDDEKRESDIEEIVSLLKGMIFSSQSETLETLETAEETEKAGD